MKRLPILFCLITGCSLVTDYHRPLIETPQRWDDNKDVTDEVVEKIEKEWWLSFKSEQLNRLIDTALKDSNDLQAGLQRIEQARASAKIAGSPLWPQLGSSGGFSRTYQNSNDQDYSANSYRGQLAASYEIDLWGANRANSEAAQTRVKASSFDYLALELVTIGDIIESYAAILTIEERLRVARNNLNNATQLLSIIKARFEAGRTSALELAQQKTALANAVAAISTLELQRSTLHNQLAVLTGQGPQNFSIDSATISTVNIPEVKTIEPALLLTRRPDILSAEAALVAANFDVGIARAAFLPRFVVGLDSVVAANPATAPASILSTMASSITAPLFQGGALNGALERANAKQLELVALYKGAVLNSFRDVEDALAAIAAARERSKSLALAAQQAELAYSLSQKRYEVGAIDFQALLDTQRSQFQADDALAQVKLEEIAAAVSLYKALGGGWEI